MWRALARANARVALVFKSVPLNDETAGTSLSLLLSPVAYYPEARVEAELLSVVDNIALNQDFLRSADRCAPVEVIDALMHRHIHGCSMSVPDAQHPLKLLSVATSGSAGRGKLFVSRRVAGAKTHAADAEGRKAGRQDSSARQCLPYSVRASCSNICVAIS
jgi:hypothetical protein